MRNRVGKQHGGGRKPNARRRRLSASLGVLLATVVLVVACGSNEDSNASPVDPTPEEELAAPTPAEEAAPAEAGGPPEMTFTYDGKSCKYTGADTIAALSYAVVTYANESDEDSFVSIGPVVEGVRADEALASAKEDTTGSLDEPAPAWLDTANPIADYIFESPAGTAASIPNGPPPRFPAGVYIFSCGVDVDEDAGTWTWVTGGSFTAE